MGKKVMSKEELLKNKDSILEAYNAHHSKSKKMAVLTKKERKVLGIGKDEGKAILNNARIAPRKAKIVIDLIKDRSLDEAFAILKFTPKSASGILYKLLKSAEANAVNNNGLNRDELFVALAYANQSTSMKRIMPRAQGRAFRIKKRTSHITLVVKERK